MNGFFNIIKPSGLNSTAAVNAVKRKTGEKCGHMGTLDPLASGVLPIALGQTARLFDYLLEKNKTYVARFQFGLTTDTLDRTGKVISYSEIPKKEDIIAVLGDFEGKIKQIPPKYSAKLLNGKRSYDLARRGVEFELSPREVEIFSFNLTRTISESEYEFEIKCKGGTYIRSLARDLGERLGSLCIMTELDRTESGIFKENEGITLADFINAEDVSKFLIPSFKAVDFPDVKLCQATAKKLLDGIFPRTERTDGLYRVYSETDFWGVGEVKDGILRMRTYVR